MKISAYARSVLRTLPRYVVGPAEVRAARGLEACGYATVRDDGSLKLSGRSDGERWYAEITSAGLAARDEAEKPARLTRLTLAGFKKQIQRGARVRFEAHPESKLCGTHEVDAVGSLAFYISALGRRWETRFPRAKETVLFMRDGLFGARFPVRIEGWTVRHGPVEIVVLGAQAAPSAAETQDEVA